MVTSRTGLPPYLRVAAVLLERIVSGQYQPGKLMPSENEMIREFGVSRTAVRNALGLLRCDDWIVTVAGRGTYVADPRQGLASSLERDGMTR